MEIEGEDREWCRKINKPTEEELKKDAYKSFKDGDGMFYVTEYGCFTVDKGRVIKRYTDEMGEE